MAMRRYSAFLLALVLAAALIGWILWAPIPVAPPPPGRPLAYPTSPYRYAPTATPTR